MRRKLSRSLRKVRLAPELESQRKARTLVGRERTQFRRPSHSSSRNASSSSSNSLDREEIKFGQIDLHPYERRCSLRTNDPEALLHKILHGIPEASVRINGGEAGGQEASHYSDPENWIPEAVGLAPNMMKTETKSSGVVKVYDNTSGEFYLSTKEDAVEQYKKGSDLIVECSGYTRQDVIFFSKFLQINAVLCWELLTKYTPDKYQKFGQKCSFYAINNTSNIESLKAKNMPIKILRIPRMLVLFTMSGIPLRDIVPATVKIISPDILIYLILQHDTAQCEEILSELKILVQKTYNASFNTDSLRQRSDFVKNTGEVSSLLLSIKERIEYKKSLLNEMVHDRTSDSIFRYLIRHLRGKVRCTSTSIMDLNLLLDASKKQFAALIDQKLVKDNRKVDSYFKLIMLTSVITGVADTVSGYMGMNVKLPGRDSDTYVPLSIILSVILVGMLLMYAFLKCFRYLDI